MTQNYLVGELSVRLEQLQASAGCPGAVDVAQLRSQVEMCPLGELGSAVARALALADALCWQSLALGDAAGFALQARVAADLRLFAACARLLPDL